MRTAIALREIPKEYKEDLILLGKGATSFVYELDSNDVLMFTRDHIKVEYQRFCLGGEVIETFNGPLIPDKPIYVVQRKNYKNLNKENAKIVRKDVKNFQDIFYYLTFDIRNGKSITQSYKEVANKYLELYEDGIIHACMNFLLNYSDFSFDIRLANYKQDVNNKIVMVDPIVSNDILEYIRGA